MNPEQRAEAAKQYFNEGYNCAQAVVLAFKDIVELDEKQIASITCGFGGGMGRMREVCGAFSGMTFMSGVIDNIESKSTDLKSDQQQPNTISHHDQKAQTYTIVQEFAEKFKNENGGSIICKDLLGLSGVNPSGPSHPTPETRTAEYYKKRPCVEIVGSAARIVAERLARLNIDQQPTA